jgi:hypothetical protein
VGHSRSVLSAPPEAIRVPSGLNATLYTSGYVECAYGGFGEGCRKRYDFVPYMLSDADSFGRADARWGGVLSARRCASDAERAPVGADRA